MLVGREVELRRLDSLLAGLADGRGFALVIRGQPGVGKSALLEAMATRSGLQVLRVCGMPRRRA